MTEARDWGDFRTANAARLERQTGADVATWRARIAAAGLADADALRAWLKANGVSGYSAQLLRFETFGYPDFMTASADELIEAQFADRPSLRPVFDAVIEAALDVGEVTVQARKTYVSLLTPRRTFARVQATTRTRLDVGLRLDTAPQGRLQPSRIHDTMPVGFALERAEDLDAEALRLLKLAYDQNA